MKIGWNIPRETMIEGFFDRPKVLALMDKRSAAFLRHAGGYARRVARNSIKTARKKLRDLSTEERKAHKRRVAIAKWYGRKPPKPPLDTSPSQPGQPPRNQTGLLRDNIFFALDPFSRSVVIGPARLGGGSNAPGILEGTIKRPVTIFGKQRRIAPRPYMKPALDKTLERQEQFWRDSLRAA